MPLQAASEVDTGGDKVSGAGGGWYESWALAVAVFVAASLAVGLLGLSGRTDERARGLKSEY